MRKFLAEIMNKKILTLLLLLCAFQLKAQVLNVDRSIGGDTVFRRDKFSINLGFNMDKQRRNLVQLMAQLENDFYFKKKNLIWITLLNTDASFNGKAILENNGYFQMRLRDNDTRRMYPDYYLQYQWNAVWGLQRRALAGCNLRFRFWENRNDDLYASIGAFYEYEKWNPNVSGFGFAQDSLSQVERYIPRLNTSLKTSVKLNSAVDLAANSFIQFPMNQEFKNFLSPRWILDMRVSFLVTKHLTIQVHYDHSYDGYRPLPIDEYYYNLNVGFLIKF